MFIISYPLTNYSLYLYVFFISCWPLTAISITILFAASVKTTFYMALFLNNQYTRSNRLASPLYIHWTLMGRVIKNITWTLYNGYIYLTGVVFRLTF